MQIVVDKHHPCLIPYQQFDPVRAFRAEHEDRAAERIEPEHLLNRQRQPVDPFAEIDRSRCHEHLYRPALAEHHGVAARAARIARVN